MDQSNETGSKKGVEPHFSGKHVFLKAAHVEMMSLPYQLKENWQPKVETELKSSFNRVEKDDFEVTLTMRLSGKNKDNQTLYQLKVEQAGVFVCRGFDTAATEKLLSGYALNILYPYACSAANQLLVLHGVQAIPLSPIDFYALYEQRKNKAPTENTTAQKDS